MPFEQWLGGCDLGGIRCRSYIFMINPLAECHSERHNVILSEAKNLRLCRGTVLEILRFAQNDNGV